MKNRLSLGLKAVVNEEKGTSYLILDENIAPRWFAKHLIAMMLTKDPSIKIIICSKLEEKTKEIFKKSVFICSVKAKIELLDNFYKNLNIHEDFLRNYRHIRNSQPSTLKSRKKKIKLYVETPIVHLKRNSNNEPAFVPNDQKIERMEVEEENFISLKKYDEPSSVSTETVSYFPMKIKQLFPNENRKKKKILNK